MTPNVSDWFRSLGAFGTAFAAVVVFTVGIAAAIVPTGAGPAQPTATPSIPSGSTPAPTTATQPTTVGGTLIVSGEREGTFVLDRETTQDRYGLVGDDGRILFDRGEDAITVARIQYEGLEIFTEPDECTVTPGERDDPTGVAGADIECTGVEDIRGGGTISLSGRVGVAADLFGLRGTVPESGGSLQFGDEELTFEAARFVLPMRTSFGGAGAFAGQLVDTEAPGWVTFEYDVETHALSVVEVGFGGETARVTGGCSVEEEELGRLNPHTRVVELLVRCQRIAVPRLGDVPVDGSVIVELVEQPG